jgi:hypothetical protein
MPAVHFKPGNIRSLSLVCVVQLVMVKQILFPS